MSTCFFYFFFLTRAGFLMRKFAPDFRTTFVGEKEGGLMCVFGGTLHRYVDLSWNLEEMGKLIFIKIIQFSSLEM